MTIDVNGEDLSVKQDHTFNEGEIDIAFSAAKIRGDVNFSVVLYIEKAGVPEEV